MTRKHCLPVSLLPVLPVLLGCPPEPDSRAKDSGVVDASTADIGQQDGPVADVGSPDAGGPDSAVVDATVPDVVGADRSITQDPMTGLILLTPGWNYERQHEFSPKIVWLYDQLPVDMPSHLSSVESHHEVHMQEGNCTYYTLGQYPLCDPACNTPEEVCVEDDVCVPYHREVDRGEITVSGLDGCADIVSTYRQQDLEYQVSSGWRTQFGEDMWLADCFDGSTTIAVSSHASSDLGLDIQVQGVTAPDTVLDCRMPPADQDWQFAWTPEYPGTQVVLELYSHLHAGDGPMIRCLANDDAGSIAVDSSLVNQFLIDAGTLSGGLALGRFRHGVQFYGQRQVTLTVGKAQYCYQLEQ